MDQNGAILGKAGEYPDEKSLAAIMVTVWADYLEVGREVLKQKDMTYIFSNTATSRICARRVADMVLLIRGDKTMEIGMLKAKADILNDILEDQLKKLNVSATGAAKADADGAGKA